MVGALQYLTMTRPDISYVVNLVFQFIHALCTAHLSMVQCIFCYLQGTTDHGLTLRRAKSLSNVLAYFDADWAGCPNSSRSTIGYAIFLGPKLISWHSKNQPTMSKFSTEAEYRASSYIIETLWICYLLAELGILLRDPIKVLCDNISATYITTNPLLHDRSKHIKVDYHFFRECVSHGDLVVTYTPTQLQLADIFTKALHVQRFLFLKSNLSMDPPIQIQRAY